MGFFSRFFARQTSPELIRGPRGGFFSRGSILVNEDSAMQVSAFHRGVIYISTQIAKLPWEVKDANNNILTGNMANLLNLAPNPEMNAFNFRCFMIQQAIIHGNAYAEIERNTVGTPINLWPLHSQSMWIERVDGDLKYRYFSQKGEAAYLDPRDVFHVRNFHTKDAIVGQGVVAYGRETLGISLAADQMASGIFHNGGVPSGTLSHPGQLSDEAYKRLKESWRDQQGGTKQGSTAILEEGVKYQPTTMEPEALQFLESRQFSVLEIARFLGIPPTKFFDVTAATYSNVENANLEVATDTLHAWACALEMEADVKLLNYRFGGRFTELDLYAVFRGDMNTRAAYFKSMMSIGSMKPNEIRDREGMAPYPEGDEFYIATNNFTPVSRMNEVIDAEIEQKTKPAAAPAQPAAKPAEGTKALEEAATLFLQRK